MAELGTLIWRGIVKSNTDRMRDAINSKPKPPAPAVAPTPPIAVPRVTVGGFPLPSKQSVVIAPPPTPPQQKKPKLSRKARLDVKFNKQRLPPGSSVVGQWSGTEWVGSLAVPDADVFRATASGQIGLMFALDNLYREWLKSRAKGEVKT